jgi:hypothetical protein
VTSGFPGGKGCLTFNAVVRAGAALDAEVDGVGRLKSVVAAHGFLGPAARQALGPEIGRVHLRVDLPLYLQRLAAPTPLNTLVKLFSLDQWVDEDAAAAAVAPIRLGELGACGLLLREARGVRALVGLAVHRDLLLAHDRLAPERSGLEPDHVLGTNAPAMTLDCLTVRRPVDATLDLGVGGGVQSLLAARHSRRVVAVDKNPRALQFARFNARLNGVAGVDLREGDFFAPVAGERFGLIVCNPPYVISPDARYIFQDSGRVRDAVCEEIVRSAPRYLEEGGFATVVCNWALRAGEDWRDTPRRWVEGSGCDGWLLHGATQDGLTYAAVWNRGVDKDAYAAAIDRWLAYYRAEGIESIAMGVVILRRRAGTNWVRADALSPDPQEPCHEHILRVFAAQDLLASLAGDEDFLAQTFRLAKDHVIKQKLRLRGSEYVIEEAEIQLEGGLGFRGTVDPYTLHLFQSCDGRRSLAETVDEMARRRGIDHGRLSGVVAEAARKLAALGFLVPSRDGDRTPPRNGD